MISFRLIVLAIVLYMCAFSCIFIHAGDWRYAVAGVLLILIASVLWVLGVAVDWSRVLDNPKR